MTALRPPRLRPHDVVVSLQLVLTPDATYPALAAAVGLSLGESHNAVQRLAAARLLFPDSRVVQKRILVDFLVHGVPCAFPAAPGPERVGVPTAHGAPLLAAGPRFHGSAGRPSIVWPSASGTTRGESLAPMCPRAPDFPGSNPRLYDWLTLLDALRMADPGEKPAMERMLRREIHREA